LTQRKARVQRAHLKKPLQRGAVPLLQRGSSGATKGTRALAHRFAFRVIGRET